MRYYCESNLQSIDHVTPSVLMLDREIQYNVEKNNSNTDVKTILDLGCGNGRNSLYIAKKYAAANVVLVDFDNNMLNWAQKLFSMHEIPINTVKYKDRRDCR